MLAQANQTAIALAPAVKVWEASGQDWRHLPLLQVALVLARL